MKTLLALGLLVPILVQTAGAADCGDHAVEYTGNDGSKLVVFRAGITTNQNELPEEVLDATLAGVPVFLHGLGISNMFLGEPSDLEAIRWSEDNDGRPDLYAIRSDDGQTLQNTFEFSACIDR